MARPEVRAVFTLEDLRDLTAAIARAVTAQP